MELGNAIFGNSRGAVPIVRGEGREQIIVRLFEEISYGTDSNYGTEFDNEVFSVFPYWWGDCACDTDYEESEAHVEGCPVARPNFLHKPSGYTVRWYKYPFRDSYANRKLSVSDFGRMIDECIASVPKTPKHSEVSSK